MNTFPKIKLKALLLGGGISLVLVLTIILNQISLFIIDPDFVSAPLYVASHVLAFVLFWLILSFLIDQYSFNNILVLLGLIFVGMLADRYLKVQNNPITIPLIILFWLGIARLILPQFFGKYKVLILLVYGFVISYYFFVFRTTLDLDVTHRESFANLMLFPIPVFTMLWIYEQWRGFQMLKADKARAELGLLKSQVNPHFFFNTLNNLYGLVLEKSEKAPEVVLKLSDMMRYTIYEGKEDLVPLKDEISYLENYIELHKIRYQKNVDIVFQHDVGEDLKIAPLLFIILLENAFKHGVEKLRESAFIHMRMRSDGKQVFFRIENNFEASRLPSHPGIGLENLKKRLAYLYPNQHELVLENRASIYKVDLNLVLT